MKLSVIVPAFNEAKCLEKNLKKYENYLESQDYEYEIIVINDGSNDDTKTILENISKDNGNVKFINNKKNKGKGYSVCKGLFESSGDYGLFLDADNSTSIEHLDKTWVVLKESEIVIGSRSLKDAKDAKRSKPQSFLKESLGILGNRLIQLLTINGIWDTQCGFKILSRSAINKIIPKITTKRWLFDAEMLVIAKKNNIKIGIIGVDWINSPDSRVGINGYVLSIIEAFKIKINIFLKKYN